MAAAEAAAAGATVRAVAAVGARRAVMTARQVLRIAAEGGQHAFFAAMTLDALCVFYAVGLPPQQIAKARLEFGRRHLERSVPQRARRKLVLFEAAMTREG